MLPVWFKNICALILLAVLSWGIFNKIRPKANG